MTATQRTTPLGYPMAPGPVGGPAAWRGVDLAGREDWIYHLDAADVAELEAATAAAEASGTDILAMTRDDFPLPRLGPRLEALRHDLLHGRGFAYLRGLPAERYERATLTRLYFGVGLHVGDPVPQNRNGHMVAHVIDVGDSADDPNVRLTQTPAPLEFHSDSADVAVLLCIRPAMRGGTSSIVSSTAVHDAMMERAPELLEALYEPLHIDRRGEVPVGANPWYDMPTFHWHAGALNTFGPLRAYVESAQRYDGVPPLTPRQREALELLDSITSDPQFRLDLPFQEGDMQFLHNHVILHGRTVYQDWPEPARKRHLMRLWLSMPDGRELPETFRERYTIIERGRSRGGIHVPGLVRSLPLDAHTPAYH